MEELNEIISAISSHTDAPRWDILLGKSHHTATAHQFLCHVVVNCYPHLMRKLSEASGKKTEGIRVAASSVDSRMQRDRDLKLIMNRVRRSLSLPIIKVRHKEDSAQISDTKRLFGFDYTDEDIVRRHNAIRSANQFMRKYCSVGRQPLDIGMVWTRVKPKRSYEGWYNE